MRLLPNRRKTRHRSFHKSPTSCFYEHTLTPKPAFSNVPLLDPLHTASTHISRPRLLRPQSSSATINSPPTASSTADHNTITSKSHIRHHSTPTSAHRRPRYHLTPNHANNMPYSGNKTPPTTLPTNIYVFERRLTTGSLTTSRSFQTSWYK